MIPPHEVKTSDSRNLRKTYAALAAYCFILMLFCTKSSPLFAFNDWFDANIYFTMGKGLANGRIPYVDLIDNKGPVLYFIYGIAWFVDNTGFFGAYLFQSLFVSISVIYVYRISKLFVKSEQVSFLIAICSPAPMLMHRFYSEGFNFGGGGPDEFSRSLMIVSLYYFTLYYAAPDRYKLRHTLIQGVLFACVALMKFNLTVFWLGFLLAIAIDSIYKKKFGFLLKHIAGFALGSLIIAVPYVIYGMVTRSLGAFWDSYFLYNQLYTNPNIPPISRALSAFGDAILFIGSLWSLSLLFVIGLLFAFIFCKPGFKIGYSLSLVFLLISVFYTTFKFAPIYIPLTVLLIFGMVALGVLFEKYIKVPRVPWAVRIAAVGLVMAMTIGINRLVTYEFFLTDELTAQQQFAAIIHERTNNNVPTLLEIDGLDSGFYTAAGIIPDEPFFFVYNVSHEIYPYPRDAQRKAVSEGHTEFVISRTGAGDGNTSPNPYNIRENYDLIYTLQGTGYQSRYIYHLFQLKPQTNFDGSF